MYCTSSRHTLVCYNVTHQASWHDSTGDVAGNNEHLVSVELQKEANPILTVSKPKSGCSLSGLSLSLLTILAAHFTQPLKNIFLFVAAV